MDKKQKCPKLPSLDRKIIEKSRRDHMKSLLTKLTTLVSHQPRKEIVTISENLEEAASYIKMLQSKVGELRHKKNRLVEDSKNPKMSVESGNNVEVFANDNIVNVVLMTGQKFKYSMFSGVIRVLHKNGVDVVNANFSANNQKVFHIVQGKVGDQYEAGRVCDAIRKFVRTGIECSLKQPIN